MTLTIMKTMFFVTNNVHMIYFNKSVEQIIFNVIQKVLHINIPQCSRTCCTFSTARKNIWEPRVKTLGILCYPPNFTRTFCVNICNY